MHYGLILDPNDAILCLQVHFYMYVMCLMSLTDPFDDSMVSMSCRFDLMIVLPHKQYTKKI